MLYSFLKISLLCFSVGCGSFLKNTSSGGGINPEPHQSLSAASFELHAGIEDWSGNYEGQGNIRFSDSDYWQKDRQIQLVVQAESSNTVNIKGHIITLSGQRSFYLHSINTNASLHIVGNQVMSSGNRAWKYQYSLSKKGHGITGEVKSFEGRSQYGPFHLVEEWIIEVNKIVRP